MRARAPQQFSSFRMILEHVALREQFEAWTSLLSRRYDTEMFYTRDRVPDYRRQPLTDAFFEGSGSVRSARLQALFLACYPSAVADGWRDAWTCLDTTIPDSDDDAVWDVLKLAASCFGAIGGAFLSNSAFVRYVQEFRKRARETEPGHDSTPPEFPDRLPTAISDMTPVPGFVGIHTWVPVRYVHDMKTLESAFAAIEQVEETVLLRVASDPFEWSRHASRLAAGERCFVSVRESLESRTGR